MQFHGNYLIMAVFVIVQKGENGKKKRLLRARAHKFGMWMRIFSQQKKFTFYGATLLCVYAYCIIVPPVNNTLVWCVRCMTSDVCQT